jgi:hypothetical protein
LISFLPHSAKLMSAEKIAGFEKCNKLNINLICFYA